MIASCRLGIPIDRKIYDHGIVPPINPCQSRGYGSYLFNAGKKAADVPCVCGRVQCGGVRRRNGAKMKTTVILTAYPMIFDTPMSLLRTNGLPWFLRMRL
jgi:hypothetical protein